MPINAAHWTVERDNGNIRYTGSDHGGSPEASYATVIEFHRWLGGLADDATAAGSDDEVDITELLPSTRSTDNIITLINNYNIDDTAAEHLYDGSIIQLGGDEIYDGIVNFGNSDVQIQIIQNGAHLADDWWNQAGAGLNPDATQGISHRFMLKVRTGSPAADIDGRRIIGTARRFGKTYSEFSINGTSRGNNVLALVDSDDLNNATAAGTVATWTTITNTSEGYTAIDVNNDGTNEYYYSGWDVDKPTRSINDFYERLKWLTRDGANVDSPHIQLYGLDPEVFRGITHEVTVNTPVNTLPAFGPCSWSGGTGQLLATNGTASPEPTTIWIQVLTGVAPTNAEVITFTGVSPNATVTASGTATERTISTPFVGASTGSAIIGSYGLGITDVSTNLTSSDSLFDLTNTQRTPPNFVTFTVGGLVHGEDYVLCTPYDGSSTDANGDPALYKSFLKLATTLNGAAETAVVVTTAIPTWLPASGTIRITNDEGLDRRVAYTSYTGSTFTIGATAFNGSGETAAATVTSPSKDVYPSLIDSLNDQSPEATTLSFTSVNTVNRNLVVLVRDGGGTPIKQYIATATLGSNNSTITAIRTTDA